MKRNFTLLIAAVFMLLTLLVSPMTMRGQSDYSTDYTGNITLSATGGTSASECVIAINGTNYNGIKAGTSSIYGAMQIVVPANTKYLHIHAAAWNNKPASIAVTPTGYSSDITLTTNSGIAGNSPFTFNGDASTSDYYKVITFDGALSGETTLTFTATGNPRFVIWGVTSEEEQSGNTPSITASNVEIAYSATSGSIAYSIENPVSGGVMSAEVVSGEWLTVGSVTNNAVSFTCSANDELERTALVKLTYTYNTTETVNKTVTVTQEGNPNGPGTEGNPYSVAEARAAIDAGTGTQGVYATGIVSAIPTAWSTQYNNITFNIVDNMGDADFLQAYRCVSTDNADASTIVVGDIVVVYGNLTKYGSTYEFGAACQLVSLTHSSTPIIEANDITLDYDATSGAIEYTVTNPVTGTNLTATTDASWISNLTVGTGSVTFTCTANEEAADRTATVVLSYAGATDKTVTVTQRHYVADFATLPFEFDGGRADIENTAGLSSSGNLGSDYSSSPKLKFNTAGNWMILHFDERPGELSYDIKGNPATGSDWEGTFTVQVSEDGETYTDLAEYTALTSTVQTETFNDLNENIRYIKWIFTEKIAGNVGIGNISLYEYIVPTEYTLTVSNLTNVEVYTFEVDNQNEPLIINEGSAQVYSGTALLFSIDAEEGYILESFIVDGNDVTNQIVDGVFNYTMPGHDVTVTATAIEYVPFEPVTYTLATTIESGKRYIIVGSYTSDEETSYYAMGYQKTSNRAGVAISVDGTTATVETEDVYEIVITALDTEGFYSFYDARNNGYLYAASSSANQLKTETELDENHNGEWAITDSIVALNSSNRNTMQFNYNNGTPIFSCYAKASQLPVALYVREETTATETIALESGFNWVTINVDITLEQLEDAIVAALPNVTGMQIISQGDGYTTYNGRMWRGGLTALDVTQMYKIKLPEGSSCEITLNGTPITTDFPITINPGNNWIVFPLNESMEVSNAFAGFNASSGDKLSGQEGYTTYNGRMWRGGLTTLMPGQGYMYNSTATEPKTLVFPTNASKK